MCSAHALQTVIPSARFFWDLHTENDVVEIPVYFDESRQLQLFTVGMVCQKAIVNDVLLRGVALTVKSGRANSLP